MKIEALICSKKFSKVALYRFKSMIKPCMDYCCHVWSGASSGYLELLDKLQTRICRSIGPSVDSLLNLLNSSPKCSQLKSFL